MKIRIINAKLWTFKLLRMAILQTRALAGGCESVSTTRITRAEHTHGEPSTQLQVPASQSRAPSHAYIPQLSSGGTAHVTCTFAPPGLLVPHSPEMPLMQAMLAQLFW